MIDHNQIKFIYGLGYSVVSRMLKHVIRPNLKSHPLAAVVGPTLGAVIGDDFVMDPAFFGGTNFSDDGYVAAGALAGIAAMAGVRELGSRLAHMFPGTAYMLGFIDMETLVENSRRNNPALDAQYGREEELAKRGILFEPPGLSELHK